MWIITNSTSLEMKRKIATRSVCVYVTGSLKPEDNIDFKREITNAFILLESDTDDEIHEALGVLNEPKILQYRVCVKTPLKQHVPVTEYSEEVTSPFVIATNYYQCQEVGKYIMTDVYENEIKEFCFNTDNFKLKKDARFQQLGEFYDLIHQNVLSGTFVYSHYVGTNTWPGDRFGCQDKKVMDVARSEVRQPTPPEVKPRIAGSKTEVKTKAKPKTKVGPKTKAEPKTTTGSKRGKKRKADTTPTNQKTLKLEPAWFSECPEFVRNMFRSQARDMKKAGVFELAKQ